MKSTQKFIAGAVCPACGEQDGLLIDSIDQSIECVDCGHQQTPEKSIAESVEESKFSHLKKKKSVPNNVSVSDIIRINNLKD